MNKQTQKLLHDTDRRLCNGSVNEGSAHPYGLTERDCFALCEREKQTVLSIKKRRQPLYLILATSYLELVSKHAGYPLCQIRFPSPGLRQSAQRDYGYVIARILF